MKASDPNFLNVIIGSIRSGKWIILENIGVSLDNSLEPILNQQTVDVSYIFNRFNREVEVCWK